jgi:hypothetical protein
VAGAAAGGPAARELDGRAASAGARPGGRCQRGHVGGGAAGQAKEDIGEVVPWIDAKPIFDSLKSCNMENQRVA